MRMKRVGRNVATLAMVLLLGLIVACAPLPGGVTPPPAPEGVTPTPTPAEGAPSPAAEGAPAPTPTVDWGTIEIRVTDPPPADVESAFVTLTNIEVQREGGGWETIIIDEVTFDLMDVIGVTEVLGDANVIAGSFTQIRLDVAEVEVVFVTDYTTDPITTDTVTARVPSEKLRIVKAFEVVGGVKTVLTLDFDGEKSLILPGKDIATGKERAIFKPVVRLLVEHSPPANGEDEDEEIEEEEPEEEEPEEEEPEEEE